MHAINDFRNNCGLGFVKIQNLSIGQYGIVSIPGDGGVAYDDLKQIMAVVRTLRNYLSIRFVCKWSVIDPGVIP
jgi:hypothetical protein